MDVIFPMFVFTKKGSQKSLIELKLLSETDYFKKIDRTVSVN